ncbi:MAG: ribonuclease H family protein, partial [Muribaculaceae bacterium]|nr:ribonuclease H family protein [Muribaculaceae bacterium]
VVWAGRVPGVYDNWSDAEEQILNFPGAKFKSFDSATDAAKAFRGGDDESNPADLGALLIGASEHRAADSHQSSLRSPAYMQNPDIDQTAWAVDASCQGNPGIMEYRGVDLATGRQLFKVGPFRDGTNNIGEFLAIVHALAEMNRRNEWHNIYSDSKTALAWVRNRQVKTQLKQTDCNAKLFELIGRGLVWIRSHSWPVKIMKWQTELWGEIPADFGRK